jgi:hypothetical protein
MDINEVPQDQADYQGRDQVRRLMYATDKEGKYTGVNSVGWDPEHVALKQAWEDVNDTLAETREQIKQGELSPLAWFMQKQLMDVSLLARYAGKWQWQVRRHLRPAGFKKLDARMLQRYAAIFNITPEELQLFGSGDNSSDGSNTQ